MKITINAKALANALKLVKPVTAEKARHVPILGAVHLRADGETVTLTAQSFERVVRLTLPATVEERGECLVLQKLLAETIGSDKGDATLETPPGLRLFVKTQSSDTQLPTFHADDYPSDGFAALSIADEAMLTEFDAVTVTDALDRTFYAASEDQTRYNLCGVHLEASATGGLTFVATDGHRLAKAETNLPAASIGIDGTGETLTANGVDMLAKLTKGTKAAIVRLGMHKGYVVAKCGNATLAFKSTGMRFPDWKKVVPKVSTVKVTANRDALVAAIKPGKKADIMVFETGEALAISYRDGVNETKRQAAATCEGSLKIAFNPKYLVEALESFTGDEVVISMSDNLSPAIISAANDDAQISVIMPMRA